MSFDLETYLRDTRARIDLHLRAVLPSAAGEADPLALATAMRSSVLDGGKRLRPCITVAACQAVGGSLEAALSPACALELVHCYSLVHDDLPAMDDDDLRRGQPTCHKRYGEATAILAGDALLTLAFELLAAEGLKRPAHAHAWLRASHELARGAGMPGMVGGQALDMTLKGTTPDFTVLERCHSAKTAALFAAAAAVGALAAGASDEQVATLRDYGQTLGLAFQHADDLRDADFPEFRPQSLARATELATAAATAATSFASAGAPLVALAHLVRNRAQEAMTS